MLAILQKYISVFVSPFGSYDQDLPFLLKSEKEEQGELDSDQQVLRLVESEVEKETSQEADEKSPLSLLESISISWIFKIIQGIYAVGLAMMMSGLGDFFPEYANDISSTVFHRYAIYMEALKVVFYPLVGLIFVKFWSFMINLGLILLNHEQDGKKAEELRQQIAIHAMTSDILLIVPIIGQIFSEASKIVHLFAGLRKVYQLTAPQSILVLLLPMIIFFILMSMTMFSVISLFVVL